MTPIRDNDTTANLAGRSSPGEARREPGRSAAVRAGMDLAKLLRAADAFMTALLWLVAVFGVLLAAMNGMLVQFAVAMAAVGLGWVAGRALRERL